jgi:transposase
MCFRKDASVSVREAVSAVARRHGLTTQQLFTWRRDARRAQASASRMAFAPVVLEQSQPHAGDTAIAPSHSGSSSVIEIRIGAAQSYASAACSACAHDVA